MGINRRTMYGFGMPSDDMFTLKGKVTFGKIRKNGYVSCAILKGARCWRQVFGLVAAERGYQSRLKMTGWIYQKKKAIAK